MDGYSSGNCFAALIRKKRQEIQHQVLLAALRVPLELSRQIPRVSLRRLCTHKMFRKSVTPSYSRNRILSFLLLADFKVHRLGSNPVLLRCQLVRDDDLQNIIAWWHLV